MSFFLGVTVIDKEIEIWYRFIITFTIIVLKKKKKKRSHPRPEKLTQLQTRLFGSSQVSGSQTRFLSSRVSGHNKPDPIRPNISPRFNGLYYERLFL